MYLDLKPDEHGSLADSTVLKCILEPTTTVMDILPIAESTTNSHNLLSESANLLMDNDWRISPVKSTDLSTPLLSSDTLSASSCSSKKSMWPDKFIIPTEKFSDELNNALASVKPGLVLPWDEKRELMKHITDKMKWCIPRNTPISDGGEGCRRDISSAERHTGIRH